MDKLLKWLVPAAGIAVVGLLWYLKQERAPEPVVTAPSTVAAAPQEDAGIHYPIVSDADTGTAPEPLPSLSDSDAPLKASLQRLFGNAPIDELLVPMNIVRHVVSTVDNLPRSKVAIEARPIRPVREKFLATGSDEQATLDAMNYQRYGTLVQLLEMTDTAKLAAWYRRFYPLFQEAYVSLGYPSGYFNDRLITVIDHLLTTPELSTPPQLVRRKVFYEFADAALEARSAGQKTLIRMGPENTAVIKRKLRELRAELAMPADSRNEAQRN